MREEEKVICTKKEMEQKESSDASSGFSSTTMVQITFVLKIKIYDVLGKAVRNHYVTCKTIGPQEPFNACIEEMPSIAPSKSISRNLLNVKLATFV